jgi:hypothetical protein
VLDSWNFVSGLFDIGNFANAFCSQMKLPLPNMGLLIQKTEIHGQFRILTPPEKQNITHVSVNVLCGKGKKVNLSLCLTK